MLRWLTLLLVLQLTGEFLSRLLSLPLPGPVLGMALLFAGLMLRDRLAGRPGLPGELESTAQGLLQHLSLLFVPAGVGVVLYVQLIGAEWLPIAAALIGSTVLTVIVTALAMRWLDRWVGAGRKRA